MTEKNNGIFRLRQGAILPCFRSMGVNVNRTPCSTPFARFTWGFPHSGRCRIGIKTFVTRLKAWMILPGALPQAIIWQAFSLQMIMHDITWGAAPGYCKPGFQPDKKWFSLMLCGSGDIDV